ncbi:hypothetical protein QEN19_000995 [Hanseniaspora menglaensis]
MAPSDIIENTHKVAKDANIESNISLDNLSSLESFSAVSVNNFDGSIKPQISKNTGPPISQESKETTIGGNGFFKDLALAIYVTDANRDLVIPYIERQGFLSRFCIFQQYKDPLLYPESVKAFLVVVCAVAAFIGPFQSSLIFPALSSIQEEYHTNATKTNISVGVYLLALGIFPIYHSSISELHGKRNVYVISFTMLFIFCLLLCLACNSINAFIILRFFCGVFSSSVQALGAGTLADLYKPEKRGSMFGIFYLGTVMAPLLAPIVGALLVNSFNWKSTQWFILIFSAVVLIFLIVFLPETSTSFKNKKNTLKYLIHEKQMHKSNHEFETNTSELQETETISSKLEKQIVPDANELATRILTREPSIMNYKEIPNSKSARHPASDNYDDFEEENFDALAPILTKVRTNSKKTESQANNNLQEQDQKLEKINTIIEKNLDEYKKTGHFIKKIDYKLLFKLYFIKPLKMLYYLQHPPVVLTIIFSGISFGILYYVNLSIEKSFSAPPYNFKPLYVGLCYIPNSVTYIIASILGGRYVDKRLIKYKNQHNGVIFPEARLSWNVFLAVLLFPPALLIIGWCFDKKVFWIGPLVGTAIFGFSSMLIIGATTSYLTDEVQGSRGVALNNFVRQICAAIACFTTDKAIEAMTIGWFFTFLTFVIIICSISLLILKIKSDYFRENYDLNKIRAKTERL